MVKGRKSDEACNLIKKIVIHELDFHIIGGIGAGEKYLEINQSLILNPCIVDVGEFPHMAAIGFSNEVDENVVTYDCGGSLISKNFVLTAGKNVCWSLNVVSILISQTFKVIVATRKIVNLRRWS